MELVKLSALCVACLVPVLLLRRKTPEQALLLTIAILAVALAQCLRAAAPVMEELRALFPQAESVHTGDFKDIGRQIALTADDYVVVMTRGHQADYEVLEQTLRSGVKYLGCIGSRRKLALCEERLLAAGFTAGLAAMELSVPSARRRRRRSPSPSRPS